MKTSRSLIIKSYFRTFINKTKLADHILYVSLVMMLSASVVGLLYIVFMSMFDVAVNLSVFQIIAGASMLIAQVFGLAGLIFWSITRDNDN